MISIDLAITGNAFIVSLDRTLPLLLFVKTNTASARGASGGRVYIETAPRFAAPMWELVDRGRVARVVDG
jgi:hypothetical protein